MENLTKRTFYSFEIQPDLKERMEILKKAGYPLNPDIFRTFTEHEIFKREQILKGYASTVINR